MLSVSSVISVLRSAALALLLLSAGPSSAQRAAHSRTFRVDGAYAAAVSVSPAGHVVVKSGDTPRITLFDGYEQRELNVPEENQYRVYESRTGQLWTLYSEGLLLHNAGEWSRHPVPEIRAELQSNALWLFRQPSLVPAEHNRVLILLPDRLISYDAGSRRQAVLKRAAETALGAFSEMTEGFRGGLWISGTNALAFIPGPVRNVGRQSEWREHLFERPGLTLAFQRPHEDASGLVTVVGITPESASRRFVVQFRAGEWDLTQIEAEKPRQAWTAWDETTWSYSYNALFRVFDEPVPRIAREPVVGAQFDVAPSPGGDFWIASAEGLVRYAPFLWRPPPELELLQAPVHALLETTNGPPTTWLATSEGLISWSSGRADYIRWPEDVELVFQPSQAMYETPEGGIAISTQARALLFDPESRRFRAIEGPVPGPWRFAGRFADGTLCAWAPSPSDSPAFWKFDGLGFEPFPIDFELPGEEVTLVRQFPRGDLWIGTDSGLVLLREPGGEPEYFAEDTPLAGERILSLAEAGDERLWCGTARGIFEFRGQTWELIHAVGDRVNAITRGVDGSVWAATGAGVFRVLDGAWIHYGAEEGLPAFSIYALLRDRKDRLWAATSRGVCLFQPEADTDPPRPLEPELIAPERPSTSQPTVLRFHGTDKWNYCSPRDLLFSYRLDEGPWTPYSNMVQRVFQNLSSGEHVIEVRAMDTNGNRSASASTLAFRVIVPWFRDPRLIGVSAIGVLAVLFFAALAVNRHLQLKRSYAEVEEIVAQRTRELEKATQDLLHSQKMTAIGTMAAGIAHDFNNILSIIKGSAQIIEANVGNKDKIRTRLSRIQTVVEQGTAIVRALLGLGRLNERELQLCDLQELLEETRRVLGDRIPERVRIEVLPSQGLPQVRCSREVLQQMLMNLILNAVDAVGREGAVILSALRRTELPEKLVADPGAAASWIVLSVSDTGCGIPADVLPRIFEPFYTTKGFSSRRGTGLGLSMVYELAKGMGYGLAVQSQLNQGSTFEIIIPLRDSESPAR